jgi:hypothetical protein
MAIERKLVGLTAFWDACNPFSMRWLDYFILHASLNT